MGKHGGVFGQKQGASKIRKIVVTVTLEDDTVGSFTSSSSTGTEGEPRIMPLATCIIQALSRADLLAEPR